MVLPPRTAQPATPRKSPQLVAQRRKIEYEVDAHARKKKSQNGKRRSTTQETMLASMKMAHQKVKPPQLAQRKFPREMIRDVLEKDTGKLMEYRRLTKNPKYRPLYRN